MMTKPDLIKVLIKEYDNLIEHLFKYVDRHDYHEDCQLHMKQGRVNAFKECVIGQPEENTVSMREINKELAKELKSMDKRQRGEK